MVYEYPATEQNSPSQKQTTRALTRLPTRRHHAACLLTDLPFASLGISTRKMHLSCNGNSRRFKDSQFTNTTAGNRKGSDIAAVPSLTVAKPMSRHNFEISTMRCRWALARSPELAHGTLPQHCHVHVRSSNLAARKAAQNLYIGLFWRLL